VTKVEDPNQGGEHADGIELFLVSSSDDREEEIAPANINAEASAEAYNNEDESYDGDDGFGSCDCDAFAADARYRRRPWAINFGIVEETLILK
jgi:hypothetical protein